MCFVRETAEQHTLYLSILAIKLVTMLRTILVTMLVTSVCLVQEKGEKGEREGVG